MITLLDTAAPKHSIVASRKVLILSRRRSDGRNAKSREMEDRQGGKQADADAETSAETGFHGQSSGTVAFINCAMITLPLN
jgi:hypothetical protein